MTSARNKIRRFLSNHNLDRPDLFTEAGLRYLKRVVVPPADRFCIDQLLLEWKGYRRQVIRVDERLREFSSTGSPQEKKDRELLKTVPGIGVVSSDVILSELAGWQRFSSLKKVSSYAGIVPGQRESAGKRKALHIEKAGSRLLRWVLVQSSWQLVKRSVYWRFVYEQLKLRMGAKKAIVAVSRRLLGVCYSLLKSRQPYVERDFSDSPLPCDNSETKTKECA